MEDPDVIIAGAGIGGLACALCLDHQGYTSVVLEKSREPAEAGAGIQIGPNAFHILRELDLEHELVTLADYPRQICIYDADNGAPLTHLPLNPLIARRHEAPYAVIHRADLHKSLYVKAKASAALP